MRPDAAAFLQYAALMNGRCEQCGRILPRPDSDHEHICLPTDGARRLSVMDRSRPEGGRRGD